VSLKYSLTFLALSVTCVLTGLMAWDVFGWGAAAFLYAAFSFVLLAAAYAGAGPGLLLKRPNGQQSAWAWLLFAPYFLLNALTFRLYRLLSREPAFVQVAPNSILRSAAVGSGGRGSRVGQRPRSGSGVCRDTAPAGSGGVSVAATSGHHRPD
jgi:hypothetical protein